MALTREDLELLDSNLDPSGEKLLLFDASTADLLAVAPKLALACLNVLRWGGKKPRYPPVMPSSIEDPLRAALEAAGVEVPNGESEIDRCGRETDHRQVPGTHFCRCTHAMYDGEAEDASPDV